MKTMETPARQTTILGVRIDALTTAQMLELIDRLAQDGHSHQVAYVNAESVNRAFFDRRYRNILQGADVVYADGVGVVWASKLFGNPLPERVNLGDCLPQLCTRCARQGYRLFFLGGAPDVAQRAAERLIRQIPGLQIVGTHHGHFSAGESPAIIEQINQAKPHILLVGMGVPKQEKWIWQHRDELDASVLWGVGALFDYYAGKTPRAPVWLRRIGFEWFFRLLVEPKRLWRRYLLGNAFFVLRTCALLFTDAILVTLSWLGAYGICWWLGQPLGIPLNAIDPYLQGAALIVGIWLVMCASFGLYRRSAATSALAELAQVIQATGVGILSTMAVAFLLRESSFGRPVVAVSGVFTFTSLLTSRFIARHLERRLAQHGIGLRRALIVGTDALAKRVKDEMETSPMGYDVLGFVRDGASAAAVPEDAILGNLAELGHLIRHLQVQDVFVASQGLKLHDELNLLLSHDETTVDFHIVSEELEALAQRVSLGRAVELPLLHLPYERVDAWYEWTKRVLDAIIASLGLLACLPLLAMMLVIIKLESPGQALFIQERIGKGGKPFRMYKFRTMAVDAPAYAIAPNDLTDPRVTRFGRFLRRWSLDELPQLVNVLKGQMSLVGPRPEMPFLVSRYAPWQHQRLAVKPGLTGLWQVLGRKDLLLHRHLEYDLYYVRHRGWLLDLVILLRTIPAVLFRHGAF